MDGTFSQCLVCSLWVDSLPLMLLGIRTALKEDTHSTAAEMVYGTTLCLPGECFTPSPQPPVEATDYVSRLKSRMQQLCVSSPRHTNRRSHIDKALTTCTHVFIHHDAVHKPLQPPYDDPIWYSSAVTNILPLTLEDARTRSHLTD